MIPAPLAASVGSSIALIDRPSSGWLVVTMLLAAAAALAWRRMVVATRPPRPIEIGDSRPLADDTGGLEPPAVVGLLTNGYEVPTAAVPATVLDLARRGWIRLATTEDGELVVFVRGNGQTGDVLQPFEQQVLNHLTARSFDGVTSAGTLAATQHRLDRRWWRRFRRAVIQAARSQRLTRRRASLVTSAPSLALASLAGLSAWFSLRSGAEGVAIRDGLTPRLLWVLAVVLLFTVAWRSGRALLVLAEFPTPPGERRAGQWLGYRRRLTAGIPERASVVTTPDQQLALAYATVMGVTPDVIDQVAITADDPRLAWTDAGGLPHVVRIRYPFRPGYGRSPAVLAMAGSLTMLVSRWIQAFLRRVADGDALVSLLDTFPEQTDRFERAAGLLGEAFWVPILWGAWAVVAGLVDLAPAHERLGVVARVRRPADVVPAQRWFRGVVERDRFSVFVAIDDGRRRSVTAWVASERTAVPEGAQARVTATRLLGHVRSSTPVGTSTRPSKAVQRR